MPRSLASQPLWMLLGAIVCFAASGATCHQLADQYTVAPVTQRALPLAPTLDDVVRVVNNNSARIQSLYTTDASISSGMVPSLRTSIALDRPRKFRLRAESFLGPEVDVGSNEELFWFWVRHNQPPALYFCRHEQFATSPARRLLPVEPQWLSEALGVVSFDPTDQHQGPEPVGAGRLRVRSVRQSLQGPLTKVTHIDDSRGWVLEQHLYDQRGERLASALTSQHRHDPASDVTLPREIEIQWPAAQLSMKIRVNNWRINSPDVNSPLLWTLPDYPGWSPFDLGNPNPAR